MRGGSQKVTNDDEGEGGVTIPPKIDDVIYEQPLIPEVVVAVVAPLVVVAVVVVSVVVAIVVSSVVVAIVVSSVVVTIVVASVVVTTAVVVFFEVVAGSGVVVPSVV